MSTSDNPSTSSPFRQVPLKSPVFDGPVFVTRDNQGRTQAGNMTREWILFLEQQPTFLINPIIGFVMNDGTAGVNVGPVLQAVRTGTADTVTVSVKTADAGVDLEFDVLQNGISIFDPDLPLPLIPAAQTPTIDPDTMLSFVNLAALPLAITQNDIFTININTGSSSWAFTVALETGLPVET